MDSSNNTIDPQALVLRQHQNPQPQQLESPNRDFPHRGHGADKIGALRADRTTSIAHRNRALSSTDDVQNDPSRTNRETWLVLTNDQRRPISKGSLCELSHLAKMPRNAGFADTSNHAATAIFDEDSPPPSYQEVCPSSIEPRQSQRSYPDTTTDLRARESWLWNADRHDLVEERNYFDTASRLASIDEFSIPCEYHHEDPNSGLIIAPEGSNNWHYLTFPVDSSTAGLSESTRPLTNCDSPISVGEITTGVSNGIAPVQPMRRSFSQSHVPKPGRGVMPLPSRRQSEPLVPILNTVNAFSSAPHTPVGVGGSTAEHPGWRRHSDRSSVGTLVTSNLSIILESGDGSSTLRHIGSIKGRRNGPLSGAAKENAKRCRQQKSICIRCKKDKQPVSLSMTCIRRAPH